MKIGNFDLKNVSLGTWIRTLALILGVANQILVMYGKEIIPYNSEDVEMWVTSAITVITTMTAWWKNNSFTKEAQGADDAMHEAKAIQ